MEDLKLKVKIYLENEDGKFMGIGVLWLLEKIQEFGSLRKASSELGISYSKAFSMISTLEDAVGFEILKRRHGGKDRAGCSLTPFALDFMMLYDKFQNNCKLLMDKPFENFCDDLAELKLKK